MGKWARFGRERGGGGGSNFSFYSVQDCSWGTFVRKDWVLISEEMKSAASQRCASAIQDGGPGVSSSGSDKHKAQKDWWKFASYVKQFDLDSLWIR